MIKLIGNDWDQILQKYYHTSQFQKMRRIVLYKYNHYYMVPSMNKIFSALKLTPYQNVKVVILGQDPYPTPGDAQGLSFAVNPKNGHIPPTLRIIYKTLDKEFNTSAHPDLRKWTKQGVLLLNSGLTLNKDNRYDASQQSEQFWKPFTDYIIQLLSRRARPIIFGLWGRFAKNKASLIDSKANVVEKEDHPNYVYYLEKDIRDPRRIQYKRRNEYRLHSVRRFINNYPFTKINQGLEIIGEKPIDWIR